MSEIRSSYQSVLERVAKVGASQAVTVIAVSKKQDFKKIEALYEAGHRDFGENYFQELAEKSKLAREKGLKEIRWHFIGSLQRNKVKALLTHTTLIHSVDSVRLAEEISKHGGANIFIQVNIDRENSKSGFLPEDVEANVAGIAALPGIRILGLMAIPDPTVGESSFVRMQELSKSLGPKTAGQLSMGMSGDFETAIRCGSTHIRVGELIFGKR